MKGESCVAERARAGLRLLAASLLLNAAFAAAKLVGGWVGGSKALLADGLESTLDVVSSAMMWAALRFAARPPDETHPYGHGKAESLGAAACALLLLAAGGALAWQSLSALWRSNVQGHTLQVPEPFTLAILLAVVLAKEALYRAASARARRISSAALMAEAWHHRSDALTSFAALAGIGAALLGGPAWAQADAWAALACCGVILFNGARLLRSSTGELLDEQLAPDIVRAVEEAARRVPGVTSVEKCRVRKSGLSRLADLHVRVERSQTVAQGHQIAHAVKRAVVGAGLLVSEVVVHIEPEPQSSVSGRAGSV